MAFIMGLALGSETSCNNRTSASRAFLPPAPRRGASSDISFLRASRRTVSASMSDTSCPLRADANAAALARRSPRADARTRWRRARRPRRGPREGAARSARAPLRGGAPSWAGALGLPKNFGEVPAICMPPTPSRIAVPSRRRAASATLSARPLLLRSAENLVRRARKLGRHVCVGFSLADEMGKSTAEALRVCKAPPPRNSPRPRAPTPWAGRGAATRGAERLLVEPPSRAG